MLPLPTGDMLTRQRFLHVNALAGSVIAMMCGVRAPFTKVWVEWEICVAGAQGVALHPVSAFTFNRGKGFHQHFSWGSCVMAFPDLKNGKGCWWQGMGVSVESHSGSSGWFKSCVTPLGDTTGHGDLQLLLLNLASLSSLLSL